MKQVSMEMVKAAGSQQSSDKSSVSSQNVSKDNANRLWLGMAGIYGEQWIREMGEEPSKMWIYSLNKLSEDKIKIGLEACLKLEWPPSLPKFLKLCEGPQVNTDELFDRFITGREPTHAAELHTRMNGALVYEIRHRADAKRARQLFREEYLKNLELEKRGEIEFIVVERVEQKKNIFYTPEQIKAKREELINLGVKPRGSLAGLVSAHRKDK